MSTAVLTFQPDALQTDDTRSKCEQALIAIIREAARSGQIITVTTEPKMLTPQEVARRLMVSRSTISRRIANGEIQAITIGNRHRIPYTEMLRIWDQQMNTIAQTSATDIETELFGND